MPTILPCFVLPVFSVCDGCCCCALLKSQQQHESELRNVFFPSARLSFRYFSTQFPNFFFPFLSSSSGEAAVVFLVIKNLSFLQEKCLLFSKANMSWILQPILEPDFFSLFIDLNIIEIQSLSRHIISNGARACYLWLVGKGEGGLRLCERTSNWFFASFFIEPILLPPFSKSS